MAERNNMKNLVAVVEELGLKGVELLALVTQTSYDVVFYANVEGEKVQSNTLADQGGVDAILLADFYAKVAEIIRKDSAYDASKLNIVEVNPRCEVSVRKDAIDSRVYKIKKDWRSKVLGI